MTDSHESFVYERFYLDPEYWDGHMIGDGQAVSAADDSRGFVRNAPATFDMNRALRSIAADSEPLDIFSSGHHFPLQAMSEGSLVLFNSESLCKPGPSFKSRDRAELSRPRASSPLPRTMREEMDQDVRRIDVFDGLGYSWSNEWGIVRANGDRKQLWSSVVFNIMQRKDGGLGGAFIYPDPVSEEALEEVGRVSHQHPEHNETRESLFRINTIEVHEPGRTKKSRKRKLIPNIGGLASRYSTGSAAT